MRSDRPKINIRLWPLRLEAEGQYAISAVRWPLRLLLVAAATLMFGWAAKVLAGIWLSFL
jgi:hypothetical protein